MSPEERKELNKNMMGIIQIYKERTFKTRNNEVSDSYTEDYKIPEEVIEYESAKSQKKKDAIARKSRINIMIQDLRKRNFVIEKEGDAKERMIRQKNKSLQDKSNDEKETLQENGKNYHYRDWREIYFNNASDY